MPTPPWIEIAVGALLLGAALGLGWSLLRRKRQSEILTEWALTTRPLFNPKERLFFRLLCDALPHHVVLAKMPLIRFCRPVDLAQVRYWHELLGSIYVTFVVCAPNGRVLAALDARGLAKNTLVVFTADNGCSPAANLEELRKFHHEPSAGYRGHKADLYEGGHRIPFIARWPGHTPTGTRCAQLIGQLDLLATCADLLGDGLPSSAGEDSVSILPLLRGLEPKSSLREALVHHSINGSFAIRQGNRKLELCAGSGGWSAPTPGSPAAKKLPPSQLYDLTQDIGETNNVHAAHP